jgi:hypothetical protein
MRRVFAIAALLVLTASAFAASTHHEWTVTYFQSDCERQCLPWFPMAADSAKIHRVLVVNGADTLLFVADTVIYY